MSDGQTFQGCPDAVRALHADIQKHHRIRPGGGSVQKCVAVLVQVADDRIPHACRSSRSSRWASNFWSSTIAIRSSIATLPPLQLDCTTFFHPLHLPFTRETPPFTQNCPICAAKACRKAPNPFGLPGSCRFLHNLYFFVPFFTFFQKRIDSTKPT